MEGYVLLFNEEFLLSFFNDKQFLNKFDYLKHDRSSPLIRIEKKLFKNMTYYLDEINKEIQLGIASSEHVLRALIYVILALLERTKITPFEKIGI